MGAQGRDPPIPAPHFVVGGARVLCVPTFFGSAL
jgi:hypothetical protein